MAVCENYGNNADTSLLFNVEQGDTEVVVVDASNFPDAPFRIRIENEAMLVTAKVGNTFTVTRAQEGTSATFHEGSSRVANVLTVAGLFNIIECYSDGGTRAALPSSDTELEGRFWFTTDGYYIYRDNGITWDAHGPMFPLNEPDNTGFAWVNQGSATVTTTDGGVYLTGPGSSGDDVHIRVQDVSFVAPTSPPYVVTAAFIPLLYPEDTTDCGLIFRASGTGEFIYFRIIYDTGASTKNDLSISLDKYDSPTVFNSNYTVRSASSIRGPIIWLRIQDNNTNLIWSISNDGKNFHQFDSRSRTDFLASGPNQIGYAVNSTTLTGSTAMTLLSWEKS